MIITLMIIIQLDMLRNITPITIDTQAIVFAAAEDGDCGHRQGVWHGWKGDDNSNTYNTYSNSNSNYSNTSSNSKSNSNNDQYLKLVLEGGYDTVGKPSSSSNLSVRVFRAQISRFELFELVLVLKLGKHSSLSSNSRQQHLSQQYPPPSYYNQAVVCVPS